LNVWTFKSNSHFQ